MALHDAEGKLKKLPAILFLSHDLAGALSVLGTAAHRYTLPKLLSSDPVDPAGLTDTVDLVLASIGFVVQLAIDAGQDPYQMRALECDLIAALVPT